MGIFIMDALDKIVTLEDLVARLGKVRKSGQKIVFTNGCFDILHVGHVRYLAEARSQGDMLIVGLNSDGSMRTIKGDKRPIIGQDHADGWYVRRCDAASAQDDMNQGSPRTAVPVVEGVNRLELGMEYCRLHKRWQRVIHRCLTQI